MQQSKYMHKFLLWRAKHISTQNFVLMLSILVGVLGGLAATIISVSVHFIADLFTQVQDRAEAFWPYFVFPILGLFITYFFVRFFNRNQLGRGLGGVLYSISRKAGYIEPDKMYSHMISSIFTVGFGGSAGYEAPIVITGSAVGSNLGRTFHLSYKKKLLLIGCGSAATVSAIFGAPIAGVIFALEILLLELSVPSFLPLLFASITGTMVAKLLGGGANLLEFNIDYSFDLTHFLYFIVLGAVTGLIASYFSNIILRIETHFEKYNNRLKRTIIGSLILAPVIFLLPPLFGDGFILLRKLLMDQPDTIIMNPFLQVIGITSEGVLIVYLTILLVVKTILAPVTIGAGGNGGIFGPSLVVGALTGYILALLISYLGIDMPLPHAVFALVGMAGVMSGVMHAPLTGIFLIAEITSGYSLLVPLMMVSSMSYLTVRIFQKHSLYTRQLYKKGQITSHNKDKEVLTLMNTKRVIEKDLITVDYTADLGALVECVKVSKRNIFPVLDEEGNFKGVINLDDVRNVMFRQELYQTKKVANLLRVPGIYVNLSDDMDQVMEKFQKSSAWNLPVLDNGKYVGFLSKSKIFNIYRRMLISQSEEE